MSTGAGVAPVDKAALKAARAGLRSVPAVWAALAAMCPNNCMLVDPAHAVPDQAKGARQGLALSFQQVDTLVGQAAAGLHALGLRKGGHVALFSENSARWLLVEQGCALNGLPTAVRGAAAPVDELQYIYDHSDAKAVVLQVCNICIIYICVCMYILYIYIIYIGSRWNLPYSFPYRTG